MICKKKFISESPHPVFTHQESHLRKETWFDVEKRRKTDESLFSSFTSVKILKTEFHKDGQTIRRFRVWDWRKVNDHRQTRVVVFDIGWWEDGQVSYGLIDKGTQTIHSPQNGISTREFPLFGYDEKSVESYVDETNYPQLKSLMSEMKNPSESRFTPD